MNGYDLSVPQVPQVPQVQVPRVPYVPSVPSVPTVGNLGSFNNAVQTFIDTTQQDFVNPYDDPHRLRSLADVTSSRLAIRENNDTMNFLEAAGDWISDNIIGNIPIIGGFLEDVIDGSVDFVQDVYDDLKDIAYIGDVISFAEDMVVRRVVGLPERLIKYIDVNYINPTEGTNPFLNALNALGKDIDFYTGANTIKSIIIPITQGDFDIVGNYMKGRGFSVEGIQHYNWDTGIWLLDLGLEIVSDPTNWITFGGKSLIINPLAELGSESIENVTKTAIKNVIGVSDDVAENLVKQMPEGLIKSKILKKQLAREISEKGLEEAYSNYFYQVLKDTVNTVGQKELLEALAKEYAQEYGEEAVDQLIKVAVFKTAMNNSDEVAEQLLKDTSKRLAKEMFTSNTMHIVYNKTAQRFINKGIDIFKLVDNVNTMTKAANYIPKLVYNTNPLGIAGYTIKNKVLPKVSSFYRYLKSKVNMWDNAGGATEDFAREFSDYSDAAYKYKDGVVYRTTPQDSVVKAAEPVLYRDIAQLPVSWQSKGINASDLYKAYEDSLFKAITKGSYKLGLLDVEKYVYDDFIKSIQNKFGIVLDATDKEIVLEYLTTGVLPSTIKNPTVIMTAKALKSLVNKLDDMSSIVQAERQQLRRNVKNNFKLLKNNLNKLPNNYARLKKIREAFFQYNTGQYHKLQNYRRVLTAANPDIAPVAIQEFEKLIRQMGIDLKDLPKYDLLLDLYIKDRFKIMQYYKKTSATEQEAILKNLSNHARKILRDKNKRAFASVFNPSKIKYIREAKTPQVPIIHTDINAIDEQLRKIPDWLFNAPKDKIHSRRLYITVDMLPTETFDIEVKKVFIETFKERTSIVTNIGKYMNDFFDGLDEAYINNLIPNLEEYYISINNSINKHVSDNLDAIEAFKEVFIKDIYEKMYLENKTKGSYLMPDANQAAHIIKIVEEFDTVITEIESIARDNPNASGYIEYIKELYDFSKQLNKIDLGTQFEKLIETDDVIYSIMLPIRENYDLYLNSITSNESLSNAIKQIINENSDLRITLDKLKDVLISNDIRDDVTQRTAELIQELIDNVQSVYNYSLLINNIDSYFNNIADKQLANTIKNELLNQIFAGEFSNKPAQFITKRNIREIMHDVSGIVYYDNGNIRIDDLLLGGIDIESLNDAIINETLKQAQAALEYYISLQKENGLRLFKFFDKDMILKVKELEQNYALIYDLLFNKLNTNVGDSLYFFRRFLNVFSVHNLTQYDFDEIYSDLNDEIFEHEDIYKKLKEDSLLRVYIDTSKNIKAKNDSLVQNYGVITKGALESVVGNPYVLNASLGIGTKKAVTGAANDHFSDSFIKAFGLPSLYYRELQDNYIKFANSTKNFTYSIENNLAFRLALLQKTADPVFRKAINNGIDNGITAAINYIKTAPIKELNSWFYVLKNTTGFEEVTKDIDNFSDVLDTILASITEEDLKLLDDKAIYRLNKKLSSLYNNIAFVRFATNNNYIMDLITSDVLNNKTLELVANVLEEDPTLFIQRINKVAIKQGLDAVKKLVFQLYLNKLPTKYILALYTVAYNNTELYEIIKDTFKKEEATQGKAVMEEILPNIQNEETLKTVDNLVSEDELHLALAFCKENLYTNEVFTRDTTLLNKNITYKQLKDTVFKNSSIPITETEYDKLIKSNELLESARSNDLVLDKINDVVSILQGFNIQKDGIYGLADATLVYTLRHRLKIILGLDPKDLASFITGPNLGVIRIQTTDFKIPKKWTKKELNKVNLDICIKDNTIYIYNTNPNIKEIFNDSQKYLKYSKEKPKAYDNVYSVLTGFYNTFMPYTNLIDSPFELEYFLPTTLERSACEKIKKELADLKIQNAYLNDKFFHNDNARIDYVNFQDPAFFAQEHYGLKLPNLITYDCSALVKRADNSLKMIDELFTNEAFFPSTYAGIIGSLTDKDAEAVLKELNLSGIVIVRRERSSGVVRLGVSDMGKIKNKADIKTLCNNKNVSAIVPTDLVYTIKQYINNGVTDGPFLKALKMYNNTLKTGMLATPGLWIRNMFDIIFKNTIMSKMSISEQWFYYKKAYQMFDTYSKIYDEAQKMFGATDDIYLEKTMQAMANELGLKEGTSAYNDFIAEMNIVKELIDSGALDSNIEVLRKIQEAYNIRNTTGFDHFLQMYYKCLKSAPYVKQINAANDITETVGRIALTLMRLQETGSLKHAIDDVVKTHFKYGGKSNAAKMAELAVPFITFPMKNFMFYWDNAMAFPLLTRALINAIRSSWSDNSGSYGKTIYVGKDGKLHSDPFKVNGVKAGGIQLGDYMFKTGWSMLDAMSLVMDPLGELESRLSPGIRFALSKGTDTYSGLSTIPFGTQLYKMINATKQINKGNFGLNTVLPSMFNRQYPNYYGLAVYQNKKPYYKYPKSNRNFVRYGRYPKVSYKAMHGSNRALYFRRYYGKIPNNIYYDLYKKNKYAIVNLRKWQAQNPSYYWSNAKNIVSNAKRIRAIFR